MEKPTFPWQRRYRSERLEAGLLARPMGRDDSTPRYAGYGETPRVEADFRGYQRMPIEEPLWEVRGPFHFALLHAGITWEAAVGTPAPYTVLTEIALWVPGEQDPFLAMPLQDYVERPEHLIFAPGNKLHLIGPVLLVVEALEGLPLKWKDAA